MNSSLVTRVQDSLSRAGCKNLRVTISEDGTVTLEGESETPDERAIAIAVARTVAGVTGVTSEIRSNPSK